MVNAPRRKLSSTLSSREQLRALRGRAGSPAARCARCVARRRSAPSKHDAAAAQRRAVARDRAQQRRLARAVRAEHRDELAGARRRGRRRAAPRARRSPRAGRAPRAASLTRRPQVGGDHAGSLRTAVGVAVGDDAAELEHDHALARSPSRASCRARSAAPSSRHRAARADPRASAARSLLVQARRPARRRAAATARLRRARASSTRRRSPNARSFASTSCEVRRAPSRASTSRARARCGDASGSRHARTRRRRRSRARSSRRTGARSGTFARRRARRCGAAAGRSTSVPPIATRPAVSRPMPQIALNSVVLPAPFGPISDVSVPGCSANDDVVDRDQPAEALRHAVHGERLAGRRAHRGGAARRARLRARHRPSHARLQRRRSGACDDGARSTPTIAARREDDERR